MRSGGIYKLAKYFRLSAGMSSLLRLIMDSREYRLRKSNKGIQPDRSLIHTYRIYVAGQAQDIFMRSFAGDIDIFAEIFDREIYANARIHPGEVNNIIDLGANIGLASLYFLNKCPHARVVAVEPDPSNFELLSRNLQPFLLHEQVTLLPGAVAAEAGTLSL